MVESNAQRACVVMQGLARHGTSVDRLILSSSLRAITGTTKLSVLALLIEVVHQFTRERDVVTKEWFTRFLWDLLEKCE